MTNADAASAFYEASACELLRAIRGKRSQIAFARRLGYRANPITDWENGRRFPTIFEALRAAQLSRIPVQDAFLRFAPLKAPELESELEIAAWLNALRGSRSINELSARTGISRYSIGRWLAGKTEPRLPDFLQLLDAITGRLHDWVQHLVTVEQVPTLYGRYAQAQAARRLALERPWSEAVLRLLETQPSSSCSALTSREIAERLGVECVEIDQLLDELVQAGIVEFQEEQFRVLSNLTVDTSSTKEELQTVRRHWAQVGLKRLEDGGDDDWFAYNVIAVSEADSKRIEQRLRAAYREVRSMVAESESPDIAAVLTMQLVRWR